MQYSPGILSSLFKNAWQIETSDSTLICSRSGENRRIDYFDIHDIRIENGLVWDSLNLKLANRVFVLEGLSKKNATAIFNDLNSQVRKRVVNRLINNRNISWDGVSEAVKQLLQADRYVSQADVRRLLRSLPKVGEELSHPFFDSSLLPPTLKNVISQISDISKNDSQILKKRNEQWVSETIQAYSALFGKLERYPLSEEQMRAAVIDEDRNLLIAAAGSGKSSTIVAKVVTLLDRGLATPDQILTLAYNKDAQIELDRRINTLKGVTQAFDSDVTSKTFHSLGLEIIAKAEGKKPSISEIATAGKYKTLSIFNKLIDGLVKTDPQFAMKWRQFQAVTKLPAANLFTIRNYKEYNDYLKEMGAKWKSNERGGRFELLTMNALGVKSMEELRIANWLIMNGISFEYERDYPVNTATEVYRQYKPDFYYPDIDLYHEHFALNKDGEPPSFMGQKYLEGVIWKRIFHNKQETNFFETTSADFHDGTIFTKMQEKFNRLEGAKQRELSEEEIDAYINEKFDSELDTEIFLTILRHFKANNAQLEWLKHKAKESDDPIRTNLFIDLFVKMFQEYQRLLGNDIDFEDQITLACSILESKKYVHGYKYILLDEAQDLSQDRKRMLHALLDQDETIKLFAVGDDWQSIYRFAGSDIDIMTRFSDHFGSSSLNYLTKTFRSYQGIIDVASEFIQRNPDQYRKSVEAHGDITGNLLKIQEYRSEKDRDNLIVTCLSQINKLAAQKNTKLSVFLLARYKRLEPRNLQKLVDENSLLDISFKTVHGSKGLEADYVLLLDVNSGRFGFPSRITDDPLLHLVIPRPEMYLDAEERRLFYVAITRAKRAVFIFTKEGAISPFIKEISEMKRVEGAAHLKRANPCPNCNTGELSMKRGRYSMFIGCSNYPNCSYSVTAHCPQCHSGKLVSRKSANGEFVGCSNYPKCKYIKNEDCARPVKKAVTHKNIRTV